MSELAVITPSYAPDFDLCRDLNRSVLASTAPDVNHYLVVPRSDLALFASLGGVRTRIWVTEHLVPRGMLPLPGVNAWVNLRRPFPPIRGWVMQQIVKLAAAAEIDADVLVLADSDVTFVRPVTAEMFRRSGHVSFYSCDDGVREHMGRHLIWHDVARDLLGLPAAGPPPLPDYVAPLNMWDRAAVLALRDRIEHVTGRPWLSAIASRLHISEFILYGVFVDQVLGAPAEARTADPPSHNYWGPGPLTHDGVASYVRALPDEAVAVMVSATTSTSSEVRREVLSQVRSAVASAPPEKRGPPTSVKTSV